MIFIEIVHLYVAGSLISLIIFYILTLSMRIFLKKRSFTLVDMINTTKRRKMKVTGNFIGIYPEVKDVWKLDNAIDVHLKPKMFNTIFNPNGNISFGDRVVLYGKLGHHQNRVAITNVTHLVCLNEDMINNWYTKRFHSIALIVFSCVVVYGLVRLIL
ncbi:MAG: hypothetical protein LBS29_04915 [Endomicrobium sp.]|jgi:hypothetical protein|nr:hypothetical protein [Endomicrobium sp.]